MLETPHRGLLLVMNKNPLEENLPEAQALIAAAKEYLGILSPTERAGADKVAEFNREFAEREAEMGRGIGKAFRTIQEELPGEMARISAGCVEGVKKFWGVTLDYTPSSLGAVEKVLLDISGDTDEDVIASAVQAFGAYFGEVVRRHWGGVWHAEDLKGTYVLNDVGPAPIRVAPFEVVREFIRSGGAQVSLGSWFESQGKRNA